MHRQEVLLHGLSDNEQNTGSRIIVLLPTPPVLPPQQLVLSVGLKAHTVLKEKISVQFWGLGVEG